jgi:hypothetical protein
VLEFLCTKAVSGDSAAQNNPCRRLNAESVQRKDPLRQLCSLQVESDCAGRQPLAQVDIGARQDTRGKEDPNALPVSMSELSGQREVSWQRSVVASKSWRALCLRPAQEWAAQEQAKREQKRGRRGKKQAGTLFNAGRARRMAAPGGAAIKKKPKIYTEQYADLLTSRITNIRR